VRCGEPGSEEAAAILSNVLVREEGNGGRRVKGRSFDRDPEQVRRGKSLQEEGVRFAVWLKDFRNRLQGIRPSRRQSLSRCRGWGWLAAYSSRFLCPENEDFKYYFGVKS
jgi:hypothetical protein